MKFEDFGLYPEIQKKLTETGFERPTEIQEKAIPILLGSPQVNFHGQAQTGTGKTLAFGLPLLHRIDRTRREPQALVVAPTRELAVQIGESLRPLAESVGISLGVIYGGVSMEAQLSSLRRGVHIVIGTPGRINDHVRRGTLKFDAVKTLVLDEADIMLDMGFKDDIDEILQEVPEGREIWLFSATVKNGIYAILKSHMKDAQSVRVSKAQVATVSTQHQYCVIPMNQRLSALCRFIDSSADFYGFVFCQTKMLTANIAEQLLSRGYRVGALHGDMSQAQRNSIMRRFQNKDLTILVATDVAARGIDVANLTHVINYSFPDDAEVYVHRAGRTGRAGREGIAITFVSNHEVRLMRGLQQKFGVSCEQIQVPDRDAMLAVRLREATKYVQELTARSAQEKERATASEPILADLTPEQIREMFVHALYDKFLKSVDEGAQFTQSTQEKFGHAGHSGHAGHAGHEGNESSVTEVMINVGSDDNVQREDITAILENKSISLDHVTKVRILRRCSFLHIAPEHAHACESALQDTVMGGRKVRASIVNAAGGREQRGGGGRRHGHGGHRQERSHRSSSYGERSHGERSRGGERPYGERSHGEERSRGERPYGERTYSDRSSHGERSHQGGERTQRHGRGEYARDHRARKPNRSGSEVRSWRSDNSMDA